MSSWSQSDVIAVTALSVGLMQAKLIVVKKKKMLKMMMMLMMQVSVLFEEMFFNSHNKSYRVHCISQPLGIVTGQFTSVTYLHALCGFFS